MSPPSVRVRPLFRALILPASRGKFKFPPSPVASPSSSPSQIGGADRRVPEQLRPVPLRTIAPVSSTCARCAVRRAMLAFCSTSRIVVPAALISPSTWKISRTSSGARPIEGSSSSSRRGRHISARPTASICCSPPERVPPGWRSRSLRRGKIAKTRSRSAAISRPPRPVAGRGRSGAARWRGAGSPRRSGCRRSPAPRDVGDAEADDARARGRARGPGPRRSRSPRGGRARRSRAGSSSSRRRCRR